VVFQGNFLCWQIDLNKDLTRSHGPSLEYFSACFLCSRTLCQYFIFHFRSYLYESVQGRFATMKEQCATDKSRTFSISETWNEFCCKYRYQPSLTWMMWIRLLVFLYWISGISGVCNWLWTLVLDDQERVSYPDLRGALGAFRMLQTFLITSHIIGVLFMRPYTMSSRLTWGRELRPAYNVVGNVKVSRNPRERI